MTNEERNIAIADMRRMKNEYMNGRKIDEVAERKCKSFEMAIKALEQQSCKDAVSRQYLLDNCVVDKVTMPYVPISKIQEAPPVTPQPKMGRWTNGDPICPYCGEDKFKDLDADIWSDWQPKYCPNCGAKMEKVEE